MRKTLREAALERQRPARAAAIETLEPASRDGTDDRGDAAVGRREADLPRKWDVFNQMQISALWRIYLLSCLDTWLVMAITDCRSLTISDTR
jgi:hypothetical protein